MKIVVTPIIDKLGDKLFTYFVSRLVRQYAVRTVVSPHMREITVLHVLVQSQVLDPILEQLIVLLEFHFIVHEQAVVLILPVHGRVELWDRRNAVRVYNFHKTLRLTSTF